MNPKSWQSVLEEVLALAAPALQSAETRWAVVGSVATALQGCQIAPNDIDILTLKPEGVQHFAKLMAAYTPQNAPPPENHTEWHSSLAEPVSAGPDDYGYYWYFARWIIAGVKVEVAHIIGPPITLPTSQTGAGMWEAGPEIWAHIREVNFRGYLTPVVPLEIQLQTNLARGLEQRITEIISVLQREGYDRALLERALSHKHREPFERLLATHASEQ